MNVDVSITVTEKNRIVKLITAKTQELEKQSYSLRNEIAKSRMDFDYENIRETDERLRLVRKSLKAHYDLRKKLT